MEEIANLLYMSDSSYPQNKQTLSELLYKSRENNKNLGISGCLIYFRSRFVQALEGPPNLVDELYNQIVGDPRHHNVRTIFRSHRSERKFANWSMAFKHLADIEDHPLAKSLENLVSEEKKSAKKILKVMDELINF